MKTPRLPIWMLALGLLATGWQAQSASEAANTLAQMPFVSAVNLIPSTEATIPARLQIKDPPYRPNAGQFNPNPRIGREEKQRSNYLAQADAPQYTAGMGSMPVIAPQGMPSPAMPPDYFRLQRKIYRWGDQTRFVLVYINTATFLPDWQPYNPQIVKDALTEWQHAMNNRILFVFTNDPGQADVNINWWNTSQPGVDEGAAGLNQFQTWGRYIAKNDIYLSLHNVNGTPWTTQQLYGFALHEIGHMLGIHEHSDDSHDIMYPQISGQTHLTARDVATLNHIYATKANFINPPGYHLARFNEFQKSQKPTSIPIPILIPSFF